MKEPNPTEKPRIPGWLKTTLAIAVSTGILYYYFADQDWDKLYQATMNANLPLAILAVLIPQLIFWFFEVFITERHFKWFHGPFPWRIYSWVRGAMYFLILVNPAIAGGGILLYLQRKTGVSWQKLMGIMLFRVGLSLWGFTIILIPATLLMHYYGIFEKSKLNPYIWWGVLLFGLVAFIDGWIGWHHGKFYSVGRLIVRDKTSEFWTAFRLATRKQWLLTIFWNVIPVLMMVGGFWFFALAFDVRIPILHYVTTSLLVMLIADLPIAFAGFGTTTMAWMFFYGDFGSPENIASLTILLPFTRVSARALIGLTTLKPALHDISTLIKTAGIEQPEAETPDLNPDQKYLET